MKDWHEYNKQKRQKVLDLIKPLCDLFNIKEYDYEIIERSENGARNGTLEFWEKFKNAFDIPESEIWRYTQNDED